MKAIILAGGFGKRLRSAIGDEIPKCMAPIKGEPMVNWIISNLQKQGITDITLAIHYKAEAFIENFGTKVKYKIENEPLGTGGAILNCIEGNDPVLVSNGDTICPIDYNDMMANHISPLSIAITQNNGHMQSAGVYIINPELFDDAPEEAFSFETFIMTKTKKFYTVSSFTDLGTPEEYERAQND